MSVPRDEPGGRTALPDETPDVDHGAVPGVFLGLTDDQRGAAWAVVRALATSVWFVLVVGGFAYCFLVVELHVLLPVGLLLVVLVAALATALEYMASQLR